MASMSKRAQARTEKELHELLNLPGNSVCADCGARNPSWASWNLGIFLCMRCASIHRKLGTHISKVKSLSMDTWSTDQVESMKKHGNSAVNKEYNPKNKKPDIPLDADEVDSAMERFIRKKYQEKSLSDGKPEVPSRDDPPPVRSASPEFSPPPALPTKKGRFFGFGLRASSSAYPLSKHDKKHRNEPRVDGAFRISSENHTSSKRMGSARAEMSDYDLQVKLSQLADMGFMDNERNTNILKRHNGDVERSIATLVKLGPSEQPVPRRSSPPPNISTGISQVSAASNQTTVSAPQTATVSNNPFDQVSSSPNFPPAHGNTAPSSATFNTNPWQNAISSQTGTGLEQSFAGLQVSQPLFPHNTGPYATQPQYAAPAFPLTMPQAQQQYGLTSSPVSTNNPFMQAPLSAHSTGSNPYASHMQSMPSFAPSTNPFLSMQVNSSDQQRVSSQGFNPFGLPPSSSPPRAQTFPIATQPQSNVFGSQTTYSDTNAQTSPFGVAQYGSHQQLLQANVSQSPPGIPNFQYGQPQAQQLQPNPQPQFNQYTQQQHSQQIQQQQMSTSPQLHGNPYFQQTQPQQQQQQQHLLPQSTGLLDKRSILALYNHPQLAPAKPLASIPEPSDEQNQASSNQQFTSPIPTDTVYGGGSQSNFAKRSATMPVSSMHSAGGIGSRNPFLTSTNSSASSTPAMPPQQFVPYPQGARHASQESMAVNNQNLQDGRHSPDAFASLSARYMR